MKATSNVLAVTVLLSLLGISYTLESHSLTTDQANHPITADKNNDMFETQDRECRDYHKLHNSSQWCNFINTTSNCDMDEGFINYIEVAFCKFKPKYLWAVSLLYALWLILLFVGLGTTAEGYFCPSLEFIAQNLKLSQNIAGITIVAFGNGSPDIFSAIAAFTNANRAVAGVAVGSLLGAAMLVTTVVAGLVASTQSFVIARRPFLRDMVFFIATTFWLFCLLYNGSITLGHSIGFLCLYVFYVVVVVVGRYIHQKQRAKRKLLEQILNTEKAKVASSINNPPAIENIDERSPLLPPDTRSNTNNNLDADGDWVDVHFRIHPIPHRDEYEEAETAVEADEAVTSTEEGNVNADVDEADFTEKSVFSILLYGLNPFGIAEWRKAKHVFKLILILQVPWNFLCKATIPLIFLNTPRRGWNRPLNCLNLVAAPLFCLFATKGDDVMLGGVFPLWGLLLIIGFMAAAAVWFTSTNLVYPVYQWVFAYIGFVVAIIWTYCIANEIVNLLQTFGIIINVSNVIMGLTFLAWGNSIGDVVADVTLAKQGFPRMSWSACFGGPLFNILIGAGFSCTYSIIRTGKPIPLPSFSVLEAVISGGVIFSLALTFLALPLLKFQVTPLYGAILIIIYVIFLVVAILAGVNIL